MPPSSIGLAAAAALTIAALVPANAHFAPSRHFVPLGRPMVMNRFQQTGRFEAHDRVSFRHGHDQRGLELGGGWGYPDSGAIVPPANAPPIVMGPGASTINVSVVTSGLGALSPAPVNYGASAGPKIIIIGARAHSRHIGKLPTVIYGVKPL
jgi:hypothetical protein